MYLIHYKTSQASCRKRREAVRVWTYPDGDGEGAITASSLNARTGCKFGWRGFGCWMGMPFMSLLVDVAMAGEFLCRSSSWRVCFQESRKRRMAFCELRVINSSLGGCKVQDIGDD